MQRKGIALLITLILLSAFSVLLMYSYKITDNFTKENQKVHMIYQTQKLTSNIVGIIKDIFKDNNSSQDYKDIFDQPLSFSLENINIKIVISPEANKINLNNLILSNGKVFKPLYNLLQDIFISKGVLDSEFLLNLILDTIDTDIKPRSDESEIALDDKFFSNSKIYDMAHFKNILDYYVEKRDDKSVYKIEWQKYISFVGNGININYASPQLLSYIFPDQLIDEEFFKVFYKSYKDLNVEKERKTILHQIGIKFKLSLIKVEVSYLMDGLSSRAIFIYDLKNKKIVDIKYIL